MLSRGAFCFDTVKAAFGLLQRTYPYADKRVYLASLFGARDLSIGVRAL